MAGFSKEALEKALVTITSLVEKSEKAKANLTKGHLTLIENRIKALRIAMSLVSDSLKSYE